MTGAGSVAAERSDKPETKDMPEDSIVDSGATQPHSVALESTPSETPAQEPSSSKLGESRQTNESSEGNGHKPASPKVESRYERTKRERAEYKARTEREQAVIRAEREAIARERAQLEEAKKPKRDYTIEDLKKYRGQWQNEGNFELVEKADKEIAVMEAEVEAERQARTVEMPPPGTPQHKQAWENAERELAEADQEFMRPGTRLDTKLRAIMSSKDGNIYRQHPRGIIAAYHRARMELLEEDTGVLRTENSKLKAELQRLTGLTSIDGGAIGRMGSGGRVESVADFAKLSSADMRKHLMRDARRGSTPWF